MLPSTMYGSVNYTDGQKSPFHTQSNSAKLILMLFAFRVLCVWLSLDPANDITFESLNYVLIFRDIRIMSLTHNPPDFLSTLAQCSASLLSVLMSELMSDS